MDRKELKEAVRLLEAHQPFVRASVVQATGSVPGKVGASMIIRSDGSTLGTVGGAALEEEVKTLARRAFETRTGGLHHFDLAAWKPSGLPSLCGGSVEVAVEYVAARPNLLLWGGGHVAHALAAILPTLEYDFSVADDRAEWVGVDRFPSADRREVVSPERLFDVFDPVQFTHLYLLGYDAMKDLEVLHRALDRFPNEIGLIASAAKREHLFARLRDRGVTREALRRIRSPVGLAIGAESPAEIAVSIVGEIVRGMHPDSLRTSLADARAPAPEQDVERRST
ncbi:MAG TPA: XdhC/CoxI family protein [Thermoplasmata archaeon]|nr:XdhC/CoxI family protein [Thermoplasmata archaeon]